VGDGPKTELAKPSPISRTSRQPWDDALGDRRQDLVFIADIDEAHIRASLDACLVPSENGFDPQSWRNMSDPFPPWHYPDHPNYTGVSLR